MTIRKTWNNIPLDFNPLSHSVSTSFICRSPFSSSLLLSAVVMYAARSLVSEPASVFQLYQSVVGLNLSHIEYPLVYTSRRPWSWGEPSGETTCGRGEFMH